MLRPDSCIAACFDRVMPWPPVEVIHLDDTADTASEAIFRDSDASTNSARLPVLLGEGMGGAPRALGDGSSGQKDCSHTGRSVKISGVVHRDESVEGDDGLETRSACKGRGFRRETGKMLSKAVKVSGTMRRRLFTRSAEPPTTSPASTVKRLTCTAGAASPAVSPATPGRGTRAEAFHVTIEYLWPQICRYARNAAVEKVQSELKRKLPAALQFVSFDMPFLGDQPLIFRHMDVVRGEERVDAKGDSNKLVFKTTVDWKADCGVNWGSGAKDNRAGLGIRGLSIKAELMMELVGLVDEPPFVKGVRAFCPNRPEIDMDFDGAGGGVLNIDLVRSKILDIVSAGVSGALVLPNCVGFALTPGTDILSIKCPPPQGVLTITVHSAEDHREDLLAKDSSLFGQPSSDPYVVVQCGAYRFRSETKSKTLAPSFEYKVVLPVTELSQQSLSLELFDEDFMSSDDFLGRVRLPLEHVLDWGHDPVTLELEDEEQVVGTSGSVRVSAMWERLDIVDDFEAQMGQPGVLLAGVESAYGLARAGVGTRYWVEVSCSGLSPGFPEVARMTKKVRESLPPDAEDGGLDDVGKTSQVELARKMKTLGISEGDMADALGIPLEVVHTNRRGAFTAKWACGFEFPVAKLSASTVRFVLKRQLPGGDDDILGTFGMAACVAKGARKSTLRQDVLLPGTHVWLKLKLGVRFREPLASDIPGPQLGPLPSYS